MKASKPYLYDLGLILLAALVAATLAPLRLISVQVEEFGHFDIVSFLKASLVIAGGLWALGAIAYGTLAALKLKKTARGFVFFVLFWVTLTGFLLPTVQGGGMVPPALLQADFLNITLALLLTTGLVFVALSRHASILLVILGTFLTVSFLSSVPPVYRLHVSTQPPEEVKTGIAKLSSEDNLIVLSLDGLPGNIVHDIFTDRPELKQVFRDFVFFEQAISQSPGTWASMLGELYGNLNHKQIAPSTDQVVEELGLETLYLNRYVDDDDVRVFTYGLYNRFNQDESTRFGMSHLGDHGHGGGISEIVTFLEYNLARLATFLTVRAVQRLELRSHILEWIGGDPDELALRLLNHRGAAWDSRRIPDLRNLDNLIARFETSASHRYISYLHFGHTHYPVDFDSKCRYRSDQPGWHDENQNYEGLYHQTLCALRQFEDFLDRLKELGVYDSAFLVLKSDHGEPAFYYDSPPHNYLINGHDRWGYNRYRPLLMVKDTGRTADTLEISSDLVTLSDLAITLCRHLQHSECDRYPGLDLRSPRNAADNPNIYINVVKDEKSSSALKTHKTVELRRDRLDLKLIDLFKDADEIELTESP